MKESAKIFDEIVNKRRSVRKHDPEASFDSEAVTRSIERMQLAPNSSNMQLWEFYRVKDQEKIDTIAEFCFSQPAATTSRELLIIVARPDKWRDRIDENVKYIESQMKEPGKKDRKVLKGTSPTDYYTKILPLFYGKKFPDFLKRFKAWNDGRKKIMYREVTSHDVRVVVHKSCALAAQTFMLSMTAEGYDTCPMEGFDSKRVKKFMKLPKEAEINMIIGMGTGKPEGTYGPRFRIDSSKVVFEL